MTTVLDDIGARVAAGQTLTAADADALAQTRDLIALGVVAHEARRRRHGARTTFVRVAEVRFDGPLPAQSASFPSSAGEVRLVGTAASVAAALNAVRAVAAAAGGRPVSGASVADLEALAAAERADLRDVARELRAAGLELVADAPIDRLTDAAGPIEVLLGAGLRVARLTVDTLREPDRLTILRRARAVQAALGPKRSVRAFAPLPRTTEGQPTTGYDDIRQVALARILVDNVPSIQVDWTLYGPKLAQVALTFGADDLDGVSALDTLGLGARRAPLAEVRRNIRAASLEPVERDGRFDVLEASSATTVDDG